MELEGFSFSDERSPSDDSEDFEDDSLSPNSPSINVDNSMAIDDKGDTVVINTSQIFRDDQNKDGPSINSFRLKQTFEEINEVEPKTEPQDITEEIDTEFLVDATKKEVFDDEPDDFVRSIPALAQTNADGTITCRICHPKYTTLLYTDADLETHNLHYHRPPILPEKPFKCFYEGQGSKDQNGLAWSLD